VGRLEKKKASVEAYPGFGGQRQAPSSTCVCSLQITLQN